ncbi:glucose-1-phosphate thymidylyltransferase RfbA [Roseicyclus sp. F158]|uniref:Glucose-1-phosphate thymidylyltransferase n=1 Tax=Tropicimonas omnivorans TaxID=3075590 RepID=A0ABU3DHP7_9RHOB|nr:glucose-1-phosphate thymidylyltransferase RfbA [Roseicyclus sp. F158]MDT0683245.1 glucose-1-phosphate thymidylyltransferase RfbA [Roseicyclus sp. F158]
METKRKGIVLAGGSGTRLWPITIGLSKQLLPVYDKPMVYYPISVLMQAGIREIAIITTTQDAAQFRRMLGDGAQWGIEITWLEQPRPDGLAQAYLIAEAFLDGAPSAMVLGDNIFHGPDLARLTGRAAQKARGASVFARRVSDPERFGVLSYDAEGRPAAIMEKPPIPPSNDAVTGLYFLDGTAPERARAVRPSPRGELEITSLLDTYFADGSLDVLHLDAAHAWMDAGTHASLLDAGNFVRDDIARTGRQVGCLEEIAFEQGWIGLDDLADHAQRHAKTEYGRYLARRLMEAQTDVPLSGGDRAPALGAKVA